MRILEEEFNLSFFDLTFDEIASIVRTKREEDGVILCYLISKEYDVYIRIVRRPKNLWEVFFTSIKIKKSLI